MHMHMYMSMYISMCIHIYNGYIMCAPTCSCLIHIVIINNIIEVLVIVVRCQSIVVLSIHIERTTYILNASYVLSFYVYGV